LQSLIKIAAVFSSKQSCRLTGFTKKIPLGFYIVILRMGTLFAKGVTQEMKATGVVRRIDDLGRVVIPKEIRRTLRIREGEPLEIFTDQDGEVILKKYIPINDLSLYAQEYVDVLSETLSAIAVVADKNTIIASSGAPKKEFVGQKLGNIVEIMNEGIPTITEGTITSSGRSFPSLIVAPILTTEVIGCVCLAPKKAEAKLGEIDLNLATTAAGFLAKQMQKE